MKSFFISFVYRTLPTKWKYKKKNKTESRCACDARLYFFSVRVLNRWNNLPHCAVDVKTVNAFKNQLEKIRSKQMDFFMDRSAKSIGCQFWNFAVTLLDFYNGGNASGAAAPGEIPGEIPCRWAVRPVRVQFRKTQFWIKRWNDSLTRHDTGAVYDGSSGRQRVNFKVALQRLLYLSNRSSDQGCKVKFMWKFLQSCRTTLWINPLTLTVATWVQIQSILCQTGLSRHL